MHFSFYFIIEDASARPPHPENVVTAGKIAQSVCVILCRIFARVAQEKMMWKMCSWTLFLFHTSQNNIITVSLAGVRVDSAIFWFSEIVATAGNGCSDFLLDLILEFCKGCAEYFPAGGVS